MGMWNHYAVQIQVDGPFAASIPQTEEEVQQMLIHRMPGRKPEDAEWDVENIAEKAASIAVARQQGLEEPEEGWLPGYAGFLRDKEGIHYEGRAVRGHLKDAAYGIRELSDIKLKNFRAKFVQKVYIQRNPGDAIFLYRDGKRVLEPDGIQQRFIQVMTRQGPRSTIKYIDYVNDPELNFVVQVLDDGVITREHLELAFEYGGIHGMGAERSQGWGKYSLGSLEQVS